MDTHMIEEVNRIRNDVVDPDSPLSIDLEETPFQDSANSQSEEFFEDFSFTLPNIIDLEKTSAFAVDTDSLYDLDKTTKGQYHLRRFPATEYNNISALFYYNPFSILMGRLKTNKVLILEYSILSHIKNKSDEEFKNIVSRIIEICKNLCEKYKMLDENTTCINDLKTILLRHIIKHKTTIINEDEIEYILDSIDSRMENKLKDIFRSQNDLTMAPLINGSVMFRNFLSKLLEKYKKLRENITQFAADKFNSRMSALLRCGYVHDGEYLKKRVDIVPSECYYKYRLYTIPKECRTRKINMLKYDMAQILLGRFYPLADGNHPNVPEREGSSFREACIGDMMATARKLENEVESSRIVNYLVNVEDLFKTINFDSAYISIDRVLGEDFMSKIIPRTDGDVRTISIDDQERDLSGGHIMELERF